jgi:hypothetical protein
VTDFLVRHELDKGDIGSVQTGFSELGRGEALDTIVEEVELDPLLVETQVEGLEIDWSVRQRHYFALLTVRHHCIDGGSVIAPDSDTTSRDGGRDGSSWTEEEKGGESEHFVVLWVKGGWWANTSLPQASVYIAVFSPLNDDDG